MISQENRDDRRRRLTAAQALVVARAGRAHPQQIRVQVHRPDEGTEHQQKLQVALRVLAGGEQVLAGVGAQRKVVVLARAVDVGKRLLVQQAGQAVLFTDGAHRLHNQLVVVAGDVGGGVFRRQLVLGRGGLVVLGLAGDAHLPEVLVQILHELADPDADAPAVVVVQLLPLGGLCTKQGAAADLQIQPLVIELVVDQKILRADHRDDAADRLVPQSAQQAHALLGHCLHRAQQRGLGVQRLAVVGAESGRDKQRPVPHKGRGGRVPGGVAPGLKGCPQAAGREGGGIRLALNQRLAGKVQRNAAVLSGCGKKGVVFAGGKIVHRLEPVGVMGGSLLDGPVLHGAGHHIRDLRVQSFPQTAGAGKALIGFFGQAFFHGCVVEHAHAEDFFNVHLLAPSLHLVIWSHHFLLHNLPRQTPCALAHNNDTILPSIAPDCNLLPFCCAKFPICPLFAKNKAKFHNIGIEIAPRA